MRRVVRVVLGLVGVGVVLGLVGVAGYWVANRTNGVVDVAGEERRYLLYVPEGYDGSEAVPLVVALHGFIQWPAQLAAMSGWNELAEDEGFIVVYPSGTGLPLRWRTGGSPEGMADVAFLEALISDLAAEYAIDPARVYVNGLSNGGGMTFVAACELAEQVAAVGMVAGAYVYPWAACEPARPVPAVVFHGTDDGIVPYEGGRSGPGITLPAVEPWVAELARRNGCAAEPDVLPAMGEVRGVAYVDCAADVVFYTVEGGGHTWPGGAPLAEVITGHTTADIDATGVMWGFFEAHGLGE
jgi:polyhydroxybutyrate depolymerase